MTRGLPYGAPGVSPHVFGCLRARAPHSNGDVPRRNPTRGDHPPRTEAPHRRRETQGRPFMGRPPARESQPPIEYLPERLTSGSPGWSRPHQAETGPRAELRKPSTPSGGVAREQNDRLTPGEGSAVRPVPYPDPGSQEERERFGSTSGEVPDSHDGLGRGHTGSPGPRRLAGSRPGVAGAAVRRDSLEHARAGGSRGDARDPWGRTILRILDGEVSPGGGGVGGFGKGKGHHCYTANMARGLLRLGFEEDPRVPKTLDWVVQTSHPKGGWTCRFSTAGPAPSRSLDAWEGLGAFAAYPRSKWTAPPAGGCGAECGVLSRARTPHPGGALRTVAPLPLAGPPLLRPLGGT
jgi:hypothetical protein